MSQALTSAINQTQHDLHMARLNGADVSKLERRLGELYKEQADETEQTLAIMHQFEAERARPRATVQSFPSGEEGFRCRACQVLLRAGEFGMCYGCQERE
jgi:aminoglycoside phosphotransferase family enzyme